MKGTGLTLPRRAILIPLLLMTAGCLGRGGHEDVAETKPLPANWRTLATGDDRDRLARWRSAWMTGFDKAAKSGNGPLLARQGDLLKPDGALDDPAPPPGDYACRTFKIGAQAKGMRDYVMYPVFTCRVTQAGPLLLFAKTDGSQRPVGTIYPDDVRRMVFLGSMMLGDENRPLPYGRDSERDMIGAVERIGPARWRIAIPYPRWEST
ncbi:MAG: hypothetical protein JWR77_1243, partial [Rhizorhabdus sp.]|nr:hypothetical protein [Rhizorhabdus sp.]